MSHMYFLTRLFDFKDGKVQISAFYAGIVSYIITTLSEFCDRILGVDVGLFIALCLIMIGDYFTGRSAAKKEGQTLTSKRGLDWAFKMGFYVVVLYAFNMFRRQLIGDGHDWLNIPMRFVHYYLLLHVMYWEFKSIGENMTRLGRNWRIFSLLDDVFDTLKGIFKARISAS